MLDLVSLAVDSDNPPFAFEVDGELDGFSVELCRLICERAGIEVRYHRVNGPAAPPVLLAAGVARAALDIAMSERRRRWFSFSQGYLLDRLAVFLPRSGPLWAGLDQVHGALAVRANSFEEEFLRAHHRTLRLAPVDSGGALLAAVRGRRAGGFVISEAAGLALIARDGGEDFREAGHSFGLCRLALASLAGQEQPFLDAFDAGLAALIASGEHEALQRRWLGRQNGIETAE